MSAILPNICEHPDGLLVRVQRSSILYQAFVPKSAADALGQAVALRDKFLAAHTEAKRNRTARSNTGVAGISETTQWRHSRPYPCFSVSFGAAGKSIKRFRYATDAQREPAFRQALAHRARLVGVPVASITPEVLP
jgi:hypothetical protein